MSFVNGIRTSIRVSVFIFPLAKLKLERKNMYHSFKNHLKDRLENRKAWSDYFLFCLRHWEINDKVSGEYFKNKPLLSIILKTYYLPINIVKFFYRIRTWHYYLKTETEIEVLRKEIKEDDKVELGLLAESYPKDKEGK